MQREQASRIAIVVLTCLAPMVAAPSQAGEVPDVSRLMDIACERFGDGQFQAAEQLADLESPDAAKAIRERLDGERDFHARLALCFALAGQGEKEPLGELIDSLGSRSGHLGAVYLHHVTGKDFGWDQKRWRSWYAETTPEEFRQFIARRRERRPMMEEYARFSGVFHAEWLGPSRNLETGELEPVDEQEKQAILALPTAKAWELYSKALTALQDRGDRGEAARLFGEVAERYPNTVYAEESRELEGLLNEMVVEDLLRPGRPDVRPIDKQARIEDLIFRLRDLEAYQWSQPGFYDVMSNGWVDEEPNVADELLDLGADAVPALVAALDDRRPIRGVGYWRLFRPERTLLRVQDAALQILVRIVGEAKYFRPLTERYFSTEDSKTRKAVADGLRDYVPRRRD
jgi:HEAT repeat protein